MTATSASAARRRRFTAARSGPRAAVEIVLRESPGFLAALRPDPPAAEVVGGDVDPAVEPRDTGLVGSVVVRRPFELDRFGRPDLDRQVAGLFRVRALAAREVLAAGEAGEDLGGGAAERAVAGRVALERWRDERRQLVWHPR